TRRLLALARSPLPPLSVAPSAATPSPPSWSPRLPIALSHVCPPHRRPPLSPSLHRSDASPSQPGRILPVEQTRRPASPSTRRSRSPPLHLRAGTPPPATRRRPKLAAPPPRPSLDSPHRPAWSAARLPRSPAPASVASPPWALASPGAPPWLGRSTWLGSSASTARRSLSGKDWLFPSSLFSSIVFGFLFPRRFWPRRAAGGHEEGQTFVGDSGDASGVASSSTSANPAAKGDDDDTPVVVLRPPVSSEEATNSTQESGVLEDRELQVQDAIANPSKKNSDTATSSSNGSSSPLWFTPILLSFRFRFWTFGGGQATFPVAALNVLVVMDRHSWLWNRKLSDKSPGESDSSSSALLHLEPYLDDQGHFSMGATRDSTRSELIHSKGAKIGSRANQVSSAARSFFAFLDCSFGSAKTSSVSCGALGSSLQGWPFEDSRPTVLWLWRDVEVVSGRIDQRYMRYTNELNCVTHRLVLEVEWTPYSREEIEEAELSPLCHRDKNLWRVVIPLIYFVMVEYHIPTHVLRQFGRRQVVPPHMVPMDQALHKMKKGSRYSETDWRITHVAHTARWEVKAHTRVRLQPSGDHRPICEVDSDDSDEYGTRTHVEVQSERAPVQDYVQLVWLTNEAGSVLARAGPQPSGALKSFVQTVSRYCCRLTRKIGCYNTAALPPQPRDVPGGPRSSRSSRSKEVTPPVFGPLEDEGDNDEDDSGDDDDDGTRGPDVLSSSQLVDAPLQFTQTQHDHEAVSIKVRVALHRGLRRNDVVVGAAVTVQMCRIATTPSTLAQADQGVRVAVSRRWTIDDVVIIGYLRHRRDF
ncbi:hypothetical protein U9M48_006971, partial [Paspalum notatum var. saurae]